MSLDSLVFLFKRSLSNIFRNILLSVATITVLTVCLLIFGSAILIINNVNIMIKDIGSKNEVVVYVREDMTEEETASFQEQLTAISNIKNIRYESKEQALQNYVNNFLGDEYKDLAEDLPADILRASFIFDIDDLNKFEQTLYEVQKIEGCEKINQQKDLVDKIINIRDVLSFLAAWIIVCLFVISIFMVMNSVKTSVYARRNEIMIMKYVGSTDLFIQFPYFLEGLIIGCLSGVLAYFLLQGTYTSILAPILTDLKLFTPAASNNLFHFMLWIYLAVGGVIGGFGSVIPVKKYLKV